MSAWIVENESLNKIVNSFYWLRENHFLRNKLNKEFNINLEQHDDEVLKEKLRKFGQIIADLNQESINQRYSEKNKAFKFKFDFVDSLNKFQFLKSVECLTYQSCEGDCNQTNLYKFLQELENNLRYNIIGNIEEYKNAKWE